MKNTFFTISFIGAIVINLLLLIGCQQSITSDIEDIETSNNDIDQKTRSSNGQLWVEVIRPGKDGEEVRIHFYPHFEVTEIRIDNINKLYRPIIQKYETGFYDKYVTVNIPYGNYRFTISGGDPPQKESYYFKYTDKGIVPNYNGAKECKHDYKRFYNNEKNTITINNGSGSATFKLWTFNRYILYIKKTNVLSSSVKYCLINAPLEPAFVATEYAVSLPDYIRNGKQQEYEFRLYTCDCFTNLNSIIHENSEFKCDHYFKSRVFMDHINYDFPITYNLKFSEVKSK